MQTLKAAVLTLTIVLALTIPAWALAGEEKRAPTPPAPQVVAQGENLPQKEEWRERYDRMMEERDSAITRCGPPEGGWFGEEEKGL
ncbi:hypothetical protein ACHHRT_08010 [Desulfurivibrio sp. D14AmB]|uniref:hypothetical protein n=1 Tax=Desulfurivibrio sp. D14AmB TaxID=3374370 RepID=UPI00376F11DD